MKKNTLKQNVRNATIAGLVALGSLNGCTDHVLIRNYEANRQGFGTEVDAVTEASNKYNPLSIKENAEYFGAVYKCGNTFDYTVDKVSSMQDKWTMRVKLPKNCPLTSVWHTHGDKTYNHKFFGPGDISTAINRNIPVYLADYTGELKVFKKGDKVIYNGTLGERVKDRKGNFIKVRTSEDQILIGSGQNSVVVDKGKSCAKSNDKNLEEICVD